MEPYLPPRYYELRSGLLTFALVMGFTMFVVFSGFREYGMTTKSSPEIGMTKEELQELTRKGVRREVDIIERCMAARESQLDEAIDMAHQHEARIAALEEKYDKAMEDVGALRASISSLTPENLPATPLVQSLLSECSSRAPSYHPYNSDDVSIDGMEEHVSEPRVLSSSDQVPKVSSPQLDLLEGELAELGGWDLNVEAPDNSSDGSNTDQDDEGETSDEYEDPETSVPCVIAPKVVRKPIGLLSKCKKKGASILKDRQEGS
ncbi:hypothetical protein AA0113_g8169 [Alternaria arborescens]|uniref:Uncharacterized protein n=1 Tax=Alternaria arborescens TaxID=156630 RepID=A0A4Q4RJT0_9PLEO|nr:hypothetical protein AA0113_g8169 [Alternaria arborescens]